MNKKDFLIELEIDPRYLDTKKQQTDYKIKYVTEYVKLWLYVNVNRENMKSITFIDCMCNCGIYSDGDLSTAMEVLCLFINEAEQHPQISFNLLANDVEAERIKIFEKVAGKLWEKKINNIQLHLQTEDVNNYLKDYDLFDQFFIYPNSILLYVDPYDFGTVVIKRITDFINRYYCEVIFNFFTSDYVRNGIDKELVLV